MKKSIFATVGALGACLVFFAPVVSQAANFQVAVKRLNVAQCSLTGSLLNIDPSTGNVSIDLETDFNCYPPVVNAIANNASLSVIGATTVGGGTTGEGTVNLQLNTGLAAATSGVTCVPDGIIASNVVVTGTGWTNVLCTNCGATVSRSVDVQNTSGVVNGTITFKAKCTYQDPTNSNLQSVRSNIQSAQSVTVQPGTAPPPSFCTSVSQLTVPNGLTDAMRQATGTVTGGTNPGTGKDFLNYTSVFGVSANTYVAGNPDNVGYGFPGNNRTNVQFGLERSKYIAWRFRAPSNPIWNNVAGAFQFIPGAAFTLAAIGQCPGQFSSDPSFPFNPACSVSGKSSDLNFKITSGDAGFACKLEPGKTYYLNVIQAISTSNLTTPTCSSSLCSPKVNLTGANP